MPKATARKNAKKVPIGALVKAAALGSVPLVGAGFNFLNGLSAAHNQNGEKASGTFLLGAAANILGTVSLGVGMAIGSNGATGVGLGLLATSGASVLLGVRQQ